MGKWKGVALTGKRQSVLSALAPQNGRTSTSEARVADVSDLPCAHGVPVAATKTLYLTASLQASRADACDAAAALFAWRHGCTIEDEYGERIDSDAKLRRVVESWEAQDELRKRDALTAHLERARTQLLARSRPDLHIRGLHLLWELACRPENHALVDEVTFDLLLEAVQSEDVGVRFLACGALWAFADTEETASRMQQHQHVARLVEVLLDMICGPDEAGRRRRREAREREAREREAVAAVAAAQSASGEEEDDESQSSDDEEENDDDDDEEESKAQGEVVIGSGAAAADEDELPDPPPKLGLLHGLSGSSAADETIEVQMSLANVQRETGRRSAELRTWPVGALHALLASEQGLRALHSMDGEARLISILGDADAPLKRALVAVFARVVTNSPTAGLTLLCAGAGALVR